MCYFHTGDNDIGKSQSVLICWSEMDVIVFFCLFIFAIFQSVSVLLFVYLLLCTLTIANVSFLNTMNIICIHLHKALTMYVHMQYVFDVTFMILFQLFVHVPEPDFDFLWKSMNRRTLPYQTVLSSAWLSGWLCEWYITYDLSRACQNKSFRCCKCGYISTIIMTTTNPLQLA